MATIPHQASLFHTGVQLTQPEQTTLDTRQDLWKRFLSTWEQVVVYSSSNPLMVQIPACPAIQAMAKQQRRDQKNTRRARTDCDHVALLGFVGVSKALGQDPETVFQHWEKSLGNGDAGIKWRFGSDTVGLRCSSGSKPNFHLSKNPRADRITTHVLANVETRLDGTTWITVRGWCYRYQLYPFLRDRGSYATVSADTLSREGLLYPLSTLLKMGEG